MSNGEGSKDPTLNHSTTVSPETNAWIEALGADDKQQLKKFERIDLTRYTDPFSLSKDTEKTLASSGNTKESQILKQAYVALFYAQDRYETLKLTEEYGKNQWLVANDLLDQTLADLELATREERAGVENLKFLRRDRQNETRTAWEYLNERWRNGIQGVAEVNVATLLLKDQVRDSGKLDQ